MVRVIQGEGAPIPALKMEERGHDSRTTRSLQKLTRHRSPPTASRKECNHLDFSSMRPIVLFQVTKLWYFVTAIRELIQLLSLFMVRSIHLGPVLSLSNWPLSL